MPTLHPQWGGYSYTWRRDLNAIEPGQFGRGYEYEQILENSPFGYLIRQMEDSAQEEIPGCTCVGVSLDPRQRSIFRFSRSSPPPALPIISRRSSNSARTGTPLTAPASAIRSRPTVSADSATMIWYYCGRYCCGLPRDDDTCRHTIASGLLAAYLGGDAGRRVHAGAVERGSVETIRAVVWYADIRGFTASRTRHRGSSLSS